ncbi:hypothetical protein K1718_03830 [Roseibium porphyridii]|uniref:Molybdopterin-guanine dinucleotide biosynthesis protein A n=1 Tax=Roseibium porphyridii TaxID=2866279 RepID=A0ABY8F4S0_9HYPH|nr:hypothetical protein [Roseibium sp. KMA01]WFE90493.1 hypothetical protein K1718_03830 [Roseibium sp. KMA01]
MCALSRKFRSITLSVAFLAAASAAGHAFDGHAGYYYPEPQTREVYISEIKTAADASKRSRAAFVVGLATLQEKQSWHPGYHLFAKGGDLEKLIIVASGNGQYDTLFRLRALLASLTSKARSTELFARSDQPHELNFFDFCKLIGFSQVTVSNGKDVAHQVKIR